MSRPATRCSPSRWRTCGARTFPGKRSGSNSSEPLRRRQGRRVMAEIRQVNGQPVIDYMARDYESLLQAMREQIPRKLPEWTDFANEADFGNVLLELFAHIGDILSYYQDRVANESFLGTARTRRGVIEHLRLIGYELGTAAPAAASLALS